MLLVYILPVISVPLMNSLHPPAPEAPEAPEALAETHHQIRNEGVLRLTRTVRDLGQNRNS